MTKIKRVSYPATFMISLFIALICLTQLGKIAWIGDNMIVTTASAEAVEDMITPESFIALQVDRQEISEGGYSFLATVSMYDEGNNSSKKTDVLIGYVEDNTLPASLRFKEVNRFKLRGYLEKRDSVLRFEPYFSVIIDTAEDYDLNPLLLFAITGQEQGFVPAGQAGAFEIANNPFNVNHSFR